MAWIVEAYLAVDKNGAEGIYSNRPKRSVAQWVSTQETESQYYDSGVSLPLGTIEKIIGRKLSWEDDPVEIKGLEY